MISLRPRLETVLRMLAGADAVADIGCDHGRLAAALLQRHVASRVIATDISFASLEKAVALKDACGIGENLELRVGDGLSALGEDRPDALVFTGMGGELIRSLLDKERKIARAARRIVMQPMRGVEELRAYLYENGYGIYDEALVLDAKRTYQIIAAHPWEPAQKPEGWPESLCEIGWVLFEKRDPLLLTYVRQRLQEYERRLTHAPQNAHKLRQAAKDLGWLLERLEEET
ncbi:MAG: class I SAM-dependent methyltransferase [Bacillota bacterium]